LLSIKPSIKFDFASAVDVNERVVSPTKSSP
jgi:hypothetical protein